MEFGGLGVGGTLVRLSGRDGQCYIFVCKAPILMQPIQHPIAKHICITWYCELEIRFLSAVQSCFGDLMC